MPKVVITLQSLLQLLICYSVLNSCSLTGMPARLQEGKNNAKAVPGMAEASVPDWGWGRVRARQPSTAGTDWQSCTIASPQRFQGHNCTFPSGIGVEGPELPLVRRSIPGAPGGAARGQLWGRRRCPGSALATASLGIVSGTASAPGCSGNPKTQHSSDVFVPQAVKYSIIAHCFPRILGITATRHSVV